MSAELDDDPESITNGDVTVVRSHGCFRRLNWELRLERAIASWSSVRDALVAAGFVDRSRLPGFWEIEAPGGHLLIVVPVTGRVQLRLHYLSEPAARPALALALASELSRLAPAG